MREEIKHIWIDALTSGEYQQANGQLKKGDSFCCLGVLCDLYAKETGNLSFWESEALTSTSMNCLVPKVVCNWAKLEDEACKLEDGSLARINDRPTPFMKIAEIIEERY